MRTLRLGWIVVLLLSGDVCPSVAQVVQVPPGSVRGIFGSGSESPAAPDLTLTVGLDGGYDHNDLPASDAPTQDFSPIQSGYVSNAAAVLRFQKGRVDRYFLATGAGSINQQQIASDGRTFRLFRGEGSIQAATELGRRSGLTMAGGAVYEPTYLFGAFNSLAGSESFENPIEAAPITAEQPLRSLTQQKWLATRASGGGYYKWTSRQRMSARYDGTWLRPLEGSGLETRSNAATLLHTWDPKPNAGFDLSYRFDHNPQIFERTVQSLNIQSSEVRFRYRRRLSPNRIVSLRAGVGAVQVKAGELDDSPAFDLVSPTVSALARLDFTRTWAMSITARRDITVLNGLSPEPFESDSAMLSLDGTTASRLWTAISAGLSRGRARSAAGGGDFNLAILNGEVRYGFNANVGLLVQYTYNAHEFHNVVVTPASFPFRYSRNSIRVGLTMWLPMYGTF